MKKVFVLITALVITNGIYAQSLFIIISKQDMKLRVYNLMGNVVEEYPIACGRNYGQKKKQGDNKTPEGIFTIQQIQNSSAWTRDFGDGKGQIKNAYGQYFIRLKTGFQGIGIHGTHAPETIGTRSTDGCIRLKNEDLLKLVKHVKVSMLIIITSSLEDVRVNDKPTGTGLLPMQKQKNNTNEIYKIHNPAVYDLRKTEIEIKNNRLFAQYVNPETVGKQTNHSSDNINN
jgi:hypothetical protein